MLKRLVLAFAMAIMLTANPLAATEIGSMSAEETADFRAAVRAYLLDNPEVLLEAIGVLEQREAAAQTANDDQLIAVNAQEIYNDGYSLIEGNPDGDITIVEFVDYRCGYCKRAFPEVQELIETDGNVRFILKEFPILGEDSVYASRFAISAQILYGDASYSALHTAMMTMRATVSEEALVAIAERLHLDGAAILAGMDALEITQILAANQALGQRLAITGTPSFVFGQQMLRGYLPLENMRALLAQERAASDG